MEKNRHYSRTFQSMDEIEIDHEYLPQPFDLDQDDKPTSWIETFMFWVAAGMILMGLGGGMLFLALLLWEMLSPQKL